MRKSRRDFTRSEGAFPRRTRRRAAGVVRMIIALILAGGAYTLFTPTAQAQEEPRLSAAAAEGEALFEVGCITCHGRSAGGIEGRGDFWERP